MNEFFRTVGQQEHIYCDKSKRTVFIERVVSTNLEMSLVASNIKKETNFHSQLTFTAQYDYRRYFQHTNKTKYKSFNALDANAAVHFN